MATNSQPVTGATIEIYRAKDYGTAAPITTAAPESNDPGYYKAVELDDGDYTYKISASGKGTVVGDFNLPGPLSEDEIQKNIPPITLISGADVNLTIYNKDGHVITKADEDGPTGPEGVTTIEADLNIETSRIIADGGGNGVYTVDAVPIGSRLIEIKPSDTDLYQNLKILRTIKAPTTDIDITLYPPITMYVTVYKLVGDEDDRQYREVDTTCRLFETASDGRIVREITSKVGNDFRLDNLSNGEIYLVAVSSNWRGGTYYLTDALSDITKFDISYTDTVDGNINKTITYTE